MDCEPPTLKCTRPSRPNLFLASTAMRSDSSILPLCRYWLAICGYHGRTLGASSITSSYRYRRRYGHFGERANFIPFPYHFRGP